MSRIGPYGMTKVEHDAAVAKRGRPLSDGPMVLHKVDDNTNTDGMTQLERIIAEAITDRKQGE